MAGVGVGRDGRLSDGPEPGAAFEILHAVPEWQAQRSSGRACERVFVVETEDPGFLHLHEAAFTAGDFRDRRRSGVRQSRMRLGGEGRAHHGRHRQARCVIFG